LTTEANLDKVYAEVKRMRLELKSIEKSLESLVESLIPEEEVSQEEVKELREIEAKMNRGECVPLEEVKRKYGSKKHAKVPRNTF
jgi:Zn-dependent M32 family carboxypeptidase